MWVGFLLGDEDFITSTPRREDSFWLTVSEVSASSHLAAASGPVARQNSTAGASGEAGLLNDRQEGEREGEAKEKGDREAQTFSNLLHPTQPPLPHCDRELVSTVRS